MKPLSEIRKENREEFDKDFFATSDYSIHCKEHVCPATCNEVKSFLSSAESRILQAVVERIDSLKDGFMCLKCEHWNDALSDLKSYIEEGLK